MSDHNCEGSESMDTQVSDLTFDYFNKKSKSKTKPNTVSHVSQMSRYTDYNLDHFNNDSDKKLVLFKI